MSTPQGPNSGQSNHLDAEAMPHCHVLSPQSVRDNPDLQPLLVFAGIAVPVGWVLLTAYQILDLPQEPFVLGTLLLGLLIPAIVLVRKDPITDGRQLWRDCYRPSRPIVLMVPALVAIPALTAVLANAFGVGTAITGDLLLGLAVNIVSSVAIVNLWEELAWTGFFQRRAMARWGLLPGSLVTAVLFAGIHLPLAFDGADSFGTAVLNIGYLLGAGVGLRLLIAGFDVWSRRSILTIAVLHASFNASAELVQSDYDFLRYLVTLVLGGAVLFTPARRTYASSQRIPAVVPTKDMEPTDDH